MKNRKLLIVLLSSIALSSAAGCSDDSASGVDGSKQLGELSENELRQFCEWSTETNGGAETVVQCEEDLTVTTLSVDECMDSYAGLAECTATVSEWEACIEDMATDPCALLLITKDCVRVFTSCPEE